MIKNVLKGMVIGIANVIPGVSGGTIAVVLHIFDRMIDAINHFTKDIKKHIMFLLPLLAGAGFGGAAAGGSYAHLGSRSSGQRNLPEIALFSNRTHHLLFQL